MYKLQQLHNTYYIKNTIIKYCTGTLIIYKLAARYDLNGRLLNNTATQERNQTKEVYTPKLSISDFP